MTELMKRYEAETGKKADVVGFTGTCSLCGEPVVQSIRTTVKPRVKPKMSKKERIKARNK